MTNAGKIEEATGKHTPLPWKATDTGRLVVGDDNECVADCDMSPVLSREECRANAALIVTAVNAHPQIEAMRKALDEAQGLLRFIRSGIARKKIKDVSVIPPLPPGAKEADLTSLSAMIDAALKQSEVQP